MAVFDSGTYTSSGFQSTLFRDMIVWPPGWTPPVVTETITLGAAVTVPSYGLTLGGYHTSAGERWDLFSNNTWSRRVGFVPGSSAGSYSIGQTLPMYRHPRLSVGRAASRGGPIGGLYQSAIPSFAGVYEPATNFARTSNFGFVYYAITTQFTVGQTVYVSGVEDQTFNGPQTIIVLGFNYIVFKSPGLNVLLTATAAGRIACNSSDIIRRLPQLSGYNPLTNVTGPAGVDQTLPLSAYAPYNSVKWNYNGVQLQMVLFLADPYEIVANAGSAYYAAVNRVWAPVAAERTVDFAVNATLPTFGAVRVVWVDGSPQASKVTTSSAPYAAAVRTGRRRNRTDVLASNAGVAIGVSMKEDAGNVRSIATLATPINYFSMNVGLPTLSVRADLIPAMRLRNFSGPQAAPTPAPVTVTGQWFRRRTNGTSVTVGSSFSIAFTLQVDGAGLRVYLNDTVSAPFDSTYGNTPGMYYIHAHYDYFSNGTPLTADLDFCMEGSGDGLGITSLRAVATMVPLHPWPFDVAKLAFAADDASCSYVGHIGWLMAPCTYPVYTVTPPGLSRAGTTITATAGSLTVAPPEDGLLTAARSVRVDGIAKAAQVGGTNGTNGTTGSILLTVAGFASQTLDAKAVDVWSVRGSHMGFIGNLDYKSGETVSNLP